MTGEDLREEISIELELMEAVVREITALWLDVADREPTVREKTAAAAFLAQFYGGVENILKRVHHFHGIPLPSGDTWHTELFRRFCNPPYCSLPLLFDEKLAAEMAPYPKIQTRCLPQLRLPNGLGTNERRHRTYRRCIQLVQGKTNRISADDLRKNLPTSHRRPHQFPALPSAAA